MWFSQPEWFLLILAFVFLGWYFRGLALWQPMRIVCLLLITLILVDPQIEQMRPGLDLWVLVDKSDSAQPYLLPNLEEWKQLLEESQGEDDSLNYLDFADEVSIHIEGNADSGSSRTDRTRIPLAVQVALSERDPRRAAKVLLLSDGYSTETLDGMGAKLRDANVPLLYRMPSLDIANDTRVLSFRTPTRVTYGEPLLLEIQAEGAPGHTTGYRLMRDKEAISSDTLTFDAYGRAQLRLIDRQAQSGSHRYSVMLADPQDPLPGNNQAESWVMVEGGPRIMLLSPYVDDPVATVLERVGLPVQLVTDFSTLNAGSAMGAQAVILNNVPAHVLPNDFMQSLHFYVTHQGGGLAMGGGKNSFGSGGYFESPIDELLPVSLELKEDHKKLAVAMAIVLDRSGSMGATVGDGQTKMDLANAGAADTVQLMGGQDAVTVLAVDSEPHTVVPLTGVMGNQNEIEKRVRSIVSMGGGIYVYTGLKAAWEELQKSDVGQKHIILFADAADAEEPGKYKSLLKSMTDEGATVSVIGLGSESDMDGEFLKDVAKLGNGRVFFSRNPTDIPSFFAQETVAVTRSAFIDEPVGTQPNADWLEVSPRAIAWPSQVDGYNLSYLKPRAASALTSTDEFSAPLVAFWRRGAGRTAAITFPLGGPYSDSIRAWPGFGDFVQTLTRWLTGNDTPRNLGIQTKLEGNSLRLDLFYNEDWAAEAAGKSPAIFYQQMGTADAEHGVWERIAPGHYKTILTLKSGAPYLGAVQWGDASLPFGPVVIQESLEWNRPKPMLQALKDAATQSGGGPATLLDTIWETDPQSHRQSVRLILLTLLALAFLGEVLWFRIARS